jgi:hypothetical protein
MSARSSFYEQVIDISEDYFGPASTRFVNRISLSHLGKPADKLTVKDLPELITWAQLAANVMSDNIEAIDEYIERLRVLPQAIKVSKKQSTPSHAR